MGKKLIGIAVIAIMLFGVFGLTACDNVSLDEYKATKSQALQDYADAKGESNYCETGWEAICKAVTDGKAAIMDATTKPAVTTAFNDAKGIIDAVEMEDEMGDFYSLEEAFANEWLTQADLKNIVFYYSGNNEDGFVASPKNPAELTTSTESKIKQAYLNNLINDFPEATLHDIRITKYFGTYNGCVVLSVWDDFVDYDRPENQVQNIGGVIFNDYWEREIYVYKTTK